MKATAILKAVFKKAWSTALWRVAILSVSGVAIALLLTLKVEDWMVYLDDHLQGGAEPLTAENPPSAESFHPVRAVARPPIVADFRIATAAEAAQTIEDDEMVLGVEIDGESRAYPINMMTGPMREVFNDELAGRPIAATW